MLHVSFWLSNFLLCLFAADFAAPPNVNLFAPAQTTTGPFISKPDTSSNSSLAGLCCENGFKKKKLSVITNVITSYFPSKSERRGGLMVSALDSGLNGPGLSPGQGTVLCSWARHLTLVTGEFTAGGNPVMHYHPIQGGGGGGGGGE